ncbi:MAG: porin [Paramuribaculum sp.]|nr:porin [Paramuribaculum sp.]
MIEENISSPSNNVLQLSAQTSTSAPNLQQMEEKLTTWQKIVANLPKISGYLQTGFAYNSLGNHTASFQAKRLRLILDGNVTEKISFRLQIEAFNGIAGSVNGNGQKNLQVMDAFATYKLSPGFQIRAGQFYTPIGYENYDISPATLETVDFSNICYRMVCRNAIGYDFVDYGRDLGIMFMGDIMPDKEKGFSHLSYNFAVTNGHLPAKDDNNKSKDIIAALTVRPVKDFNLKVGYNWGEYKPWNPNSDTFAGVGNYQSMNRFVVGAWYNNPTGLDLRAEFGNIIAKNNGYELVKETGFYLLAAYRIGGYRWLPVLRYDMYHDSVNKYSLNNYNRGLAGLTYQPHPNVKIQLNYLLSFYSKEVADVSNNGKKNSSQLLLMGLFKF